MASSNRYRSLNHTPIDCFALAKESPNREKAYLLQNSLNLAQSEIIPTYVYKTGLINADFSMATAVGLFNSVVNLCLLLVVNFVAKRVTGNGLWR